jgi:hypothetical protein
MLPDTTISELHSCQPVPDGRSTDPGNMFLAYLFLLEDAQGMRNARYRKAMIF